MRFKPTQEELMAQQNLPAMMTISEFLSWSRMGRTKIYELLGSGELAAIKIGRRTFITSDAAEAWFKAQPAYKPPANDE
jgi:hypothetical protein